MANGAGEETTLVFRVFFIGAVNPVGLKVESMPGEVVSIEFQNYRRSNSYGYNGNQPVVFFREFVQADNTVNRLPAATVHLSNSECEQLIIFVPVDNKKESVSEFQLFSLDDSLAFFPLETLIVFNATTNKLIGRIGKENYVFSQGFSKVFPMREFYDTEEELFMMPVGFAAEYEEGSELVFTNTFEFHPGNRIVLILSPPARPGSHRLKVNKLIDAPPAFFQIEE